MNKLLNYKSYFLFRIPWKSEEYVAVETPSGRVHLPLYSNGDIFTHKKSSATQRNNASYATVVTTDHHYHRLYKS
jgi:hypothetical protein